VERGAPMPVAFASAPQGASKEMEVHTSTEVCSIKIVQRRARQAPAVRAFNVGLPPIGQSGP
jgi:hypothetical protein